MNGTTKPKPPADYDDNPPWTDDEFARAVIVRNGRIVSPEADRLREVLRTIADASDLETCHDLARRALR